MKYAKSIAGAVAAGSTALVTALADGSLSSGEGLAVALAVLASLGIVAAVPNKQARV